MSASNNLSLALQMQFSFEFTHISYNSWCSWQCTVV